MATTSNTHTANGSTVDFAFTFPYLKSSDIKVSVDEVLQELTTHYTLHNATTIRFGSAPADTKKVKIYRDTASAELAATFYAGSAIRSSDLNDNYTQNLYVTQEAENDSTEALSNSRVLESGAYVSAITKATTAVTTANTASDNAAAAVVTANNADNTADQASADATTAVNTANAADTIADNAKLATDRLVGTTSNNGSTWTVTGNNTNASTDPKGLGYAITTADTAKATADTAKTTADAADGKSDTAINTANAADTIADTAKLATDRLVATTSNDGATWTLAGNNTNASTDPKGVGYAVTQAEAAVTTANSAAASVAAAQLYTIVANYAALPTISSSNHEDFYQVTDSTAISRSSGTFSPTTVADPNSQAPNDFQGDDELTVKLRANNTSGKWEWQEYYANDSESRYRKKVIVENKNSITENYTIGANNNAFSVGPVTIANGYTVTIPANQLYFVN